MFRGIQSVNMDAKGRLQVPARFRDALQALCDGRLVLTRDTEEQCLLLYPEPTWSGDIEPKLEALPSLNPAARRLQRLMIGNACDLDIDASGRILVPPKLREILGEERKLVLIGQGRKLELWAESHWNQRSQEMVEAMAGVESLPAEMQSLSL